MGTKKKAGLQAPRIENRRARFDYHIDEQLEAGIVLEGTEVKSLRLGNANIKESYAGQQEGEIWLYNVHIQSYTQGNRFNHVERRPRKLLLKKREIKMLIGLLETKGVTLVPLHLFFNKKGIAKIMLGVARGKKQHDKRETEKNRDWQREKARIMKHDV